MCKSEQAAVARGCYLAKSHRCWQMEMRLASESGEQQRTMARAPVAFTMSLQMEASLTAPSEHTAEHSLVTETEEICVSVGCIQL
jgi:hypothetical protein